MILVLAVLSLSAYARAEIPDGYIMQLTATCGADTDAVGTLEIVTDLDLSAKAECRTNTNDFTSTDNVNFELDFSYVGGSGGETCEFDQRDGAEVYFAKVVISYGEPDQLVHQYTEEYTVTCTFSPSGTDESADQTLEETLIASKEIQTAVGSATDGTIALEVQDVLGDDLSSTNIAIGRYIMLNAAFSSGTGAGLRPTACDAIDSSDNKYAILRAGCGDGIVFDKDVGFMSDGMETTSPYFRAFAINGDTALSFECNFTVCASACDGDSCDVDRKRRRRGIGLVTDEAEVFATASTAPVSLLGTGQRFSVGVGRVEQTPKK